MPQALAIIPARFGSTRFPGKPLVDRTGKPLIQHVVERVRLAKTISRIVVATDDRRIAEAVEAFGGEAVMTGEHPNGTSRIAEAVDTLEKNNRESFPEIIANVQGDEPEIEPAVIDALVEGLVASGGAPMATLAADFAADEDPTDPNIVKVVVNQLGRAMYFSRSIIPFNRDGLLNLTPLKHPGLYAYQRSFLPEYVALPPTPAEETEKLEQLRALEHGYPIAIVKADVRHHGIDTPEQYDAFVARVGLNG